MTSPLPLRDRLALLAAFADEFAAPGFNFGHWVNSWPDASGVIHLGYYEFSDRALAFFAAAGRGEWVTPKVNWTEWAGTAEAQALRHDPVAVEAATPDQLQRLLTMLIRSDRFSEGAVAEAFETGLLMRIVRRAADLAEQVPKFGA